MRNDINIVTCSITIQIDIQIHRLRTKLNQLYNINIMYKYQYNTIYTLYILYYYIHVFCCLYVTRGGRPDNRQQGQV